MVILRERRTVEFEPGWEEEIQRLGSGE